MEQVIAPPKTNELGFYEMRLDSFEQEVERRWKRLKAMHEHPLL